MSLRDDAFRWDMLGSKMYVGELATRLPALSINRLTPFYRNISAKDFIVEKAKSLIRIDGIPESPLVNFTLENADVTCINLIRAADAKDITIKNAVIRSQNSLISLTDIRNFKFENVLFKVPGDELTATVSGELSDDIKFKNTIPRKPKNWPGESWDK